MNIFSILTEEYKDLLELSVKSWLSFNTVNKIYLFTDFSLNVKKTLSPRLIVIPKIKKGLDWLKITALKPVLMKEVIENFDSNLSFNYVFLDADCVIFRDVSHIFDTSFDITASRLTLERFPANSGVFFFRTNNRTLRFANEWIETELKFLNKKIGTTPYKNNYEQMAFSLILKLQLQRRLDAKEELWNTSSEKQHNYYLTVHNLPSQYNCESDSKETLLSNIISHKPYIVHFKGRSWKDIEFVNKVKLVYNK